MRYFENKTICFVLIVLLGTITFLPLLNAGFIHLDDKLLLGADFVDDFNLPKMFSFESTEETINIYIPLTSLSFAVEKKLGVLFAYQYHLDNIILHFIVTLLILFLVLRLGFSLPIASIAALLFCIHPIHLESFAWISERKDVLYSIFYLSSILFYIHHSFYYHKDNSSVFYLLSLFFGIFAILAKPMALSLPLILLLIDWHFRRVFSFKTLIEKIPFFLCISFFAVVTFLHVEKANLTIESPLIWIWCLTWYLKKFFLPFEFGNAYPIPEPISLSNPEYIFSVIIFVCIGLLLWIYRHNRLFVFSFLFYFLSIFFLLRLDIKDFHTVADRYMYLPSFGFCLLTATWLNDVIKKHKVALILFVLLIAQLSIKTNQLTAVWKNSYSFWKSAINVGTEESYFYRQLGESLFREANYEEAIINFTKALKLIEKRNKIDSLWAEEKIYISRGDCYFYLGEYDLAVKDLTRASEIYNTDKPDPKLEYKINSHLARSLKNLKKWRKNDDTDDTATGRNTF